MVIKTDDIEIIPAYNVRKRGDTWYKYILNGRESNQCGETPEIAFLLALGEKHGGLNSQFTHFATRMLGIETVWAER